MSSVGKPPFFIGATMAFTPETGTGIEGANAAIEVSFADEYHATRDNIAWASLSDNKKQGAIVKATDYIYRTYSFDGLSFTTKQRLHFPIFDVEGNSPYYPEKFKEAVAELAFIAKDRELIDRSPRNRGWQIEDSQGPIVAKFAPGEGSPSNKPDLTWLDDMLADFLLDTSSGDYTYVERA